MNPQIQTVGIGVKEIAEITIYPLSMADQFRLSDVIAEAITEYTANEQKKEDALLEWQVQYKDDLENNLDKMPVQSSDVEIFQIFIKTIQENLINILDLITETDNQITLDDLTNDQFAELCDIIYTVNYDNAMGKFQALIQRAKSAFQLVKQSPKLSSPLATDTNISTVSHSEMEE